MPGVADAAARRAHVRWRDRIQPAFGVAFGSFVVIGVTDAVLGVAWPAIRRSLGLPIGDLGLIQVAGTLGFLVSSALSGRVSAWRGRARAMAAAGTLGAGALVAFAGAPRIAVLLAAALVIGTAGGQIEPGMQTHVALHARDRAMNFLHGCYGIGATVGPILVSSLLLLHASWRLAYLALAGAEAVVVVVGVLRRRRVFEAETPVAALDVHPHRSPQATTDAGLARPVLLTSLALFFVYVGVEVGTGQWAFTVLTSARHLGAGTAGALVSGYWAALTGVRFLAAALGHRVDPEVVLSVSAGAALVGECLMWWNPLPAIGDVGLLLTGGALAPAFPLMMARTPRWASARLSSVIGWQSAVSSLGIAVLSGLAALLVQRLGLAVLGPYLIALAAAFLALQLLALRFEHFAATRRPPHR